MKTIYQVVCWVAWTWLLLYQADTAMAQRAFDEPCHKTGIYGFLEEKSEDMQIMYPANWAQATYVSAHPAVGGGYVVGTNEYGDLAKA